MFDKNPYENDEVNVPNFGDSEEKGTDPIFNMDTTSVSSETDSLDAEEEAESSSKLAIIVLIVFLVLFLVGTISGWIYGISKSKEVSTIKEESTALQEKLEKQITDLQTQVSSLQLELEQAKTSTSDVPSSEGESSSQTTSAKASAYYTMIEGVSVRPSAGASGDSFADYTKLPDDIKNIVYQDGKKITTRAAKFPVYETKEAGGRNWGRIADGAWVCIDAEFATKQ